MSNREGGGSSRYEVLDQQDVVSCRETELDEVFLFEFDVARVIYPLSVDIGTIGRLEIDHVWLHFEWRCRSVFWQQLL